MKKSLILVLMVLFVVVSICQTEAKMVTAHWTAVISSLISERDQTVEDIWDVGDVITWTVTYDDSNTERHIYNDGPNGIGEFGANDDTLFGTYTCDPGDYCSDATFSFDVKTEQYIESLSDSNTTNSADQIHEDWRGGPSGGYSKDGFSMNSFWGDMKFGQFFNNSLGLESSVVSFQVTGYSESTVSLPATIMLLLANKQNKLVGESCTDSRVCVSGFCVDGVCTASCDDLLLNGDETDIDCGGACSPCLSGDSCATNADCQTGVCLGDNTCQ